MRNYFEQPSSSLFDNIKKIRQERGLSQGRLANLIGVSVPTISKIENGITDINLSRMYQIAQACQVSVLQLLTGDSAKQEDKTVSFNSSKIGRKIAKRNVEILNLRRKIIELNQELYDMRKKDELKQSMMELDAAS